MSKWPAPKWFGRMVGATLAILALATLSVGSSPASAIHLDRLGAARVYGAVSTGSSGPGEGGLELGLRDGAFGLLKAARRWWRGFGRVVGMALRRWTDWLPKLVVTMALLVLAPVCNGSLWRTWRQQGMSACIGAVVLGVAIYVRLLGDRRIPDVARLLLGCAVTYAVAGNDLIPDSTGIWGSFDDILAVLVCSNCFVRLCPDGTLVEHARGAREGWARGKRRRSQGVSQGRK